ncbi:MAG: BTAD domain-containing putative transcriptional regulator, partial [Candidatus Hydrogenedentales bacterium]
LKFERVYASARRALEAGDNKTALSKCRAALQLLEQEALYGSRQDELIRALTEQIEHLASSEHEQEAS